MLPRVSTSNEKAPSSLTISTMVDNSDIDNTAGALGPRWSPALLRFTSVVVIHVLCRNGDESLAVRNGDDAVVVRLRLQRLNALLSERFDVPLLLQITVTNHLVIGL